MADCGIVELWNCEIVKLCNCEIVELWNLHCGIYPIILLFFMADFVDSGMGIVKFIERLKWYSGNFTM